MIDRPQSLNHVIPGEAASRADPGSKGVEFSVWIPDRRFTLAGLTRFKRRGELEPQTFQVTLRDAQ